MSSGSPYLMLGYPDTPYFVQSSFPSVVQSTSATKDVVESLNSSISLSQSGFSFLQWPHHGAKNLMKTLFPATAASQVSGVSSVADAARAPSSRSRGSLMIVLWAVGLSAGAAASQ